MRRRERGACPASVGRGARYRHARRNGRRLWRHGRDADKGQCGRAAGNTLPTGAILVVLITILGPISGAHFNPAVSLVFALKRELPQRDAVPYIAAQIIGGVAGTLAAHLMFALPLIETSLKARTGAAQWFAEWVATFGLIVTILAGIRFARRFGAMACRALYHRRLLVHCLHLLCQSGGSDCALAHEYVLGHSPD